MELHQLKQFVAAAESESFTRGAERAFVSQPALSASISKLEEEMGVKLFIRNKRSVVLTPSGRKLLKRAKLIIAECAQAKAELKHHEVHRSLRLGVIDTLSIKQVANLIEQCRRKNPEIVMEVTDAREDQIENYQQEARIDFALTLLGQGPVKNQEPEARRSCSANHTLSRCPLVIICVSAKRSVSLSWPRSLLSPARPYCENRFFIGELLKEKGHRLNPVYKTYQDDRAIALVEAGVGSAIIPQHYSSPAITKIGLTEMQTQRQISFSWTDNSNLEEIMKFVDFSKTVPWADRNMKI